jgi:biopolymer transport protein ExbB
MLIQTLAAAATSAAPQNKFGFVEALRPAVSFPTPPSRSWVMSFGSFFILFTKFLEQSKIME